jgi:hypothetical protein
MQSTSSTNQANRQSWSSQNQENRQSYGQQAQQSRQNYASNHDDYHYSGYGGYYYHPPTYGYGGAYAAGAVTGAIIGSTMTAAAFSAMSTPKTPVVVGGVTYYQVGSTWYQPVYQSGQVTYVVVQPPQ